MSSTSLPAGFQKQMADLLGKEYLSFLQSYDAPRAYGLRLHPGKAEPGSPAFAHMQNEFGLEPVPWCPTGYYYREGARPGKHPYHAAGLYYLQEPSAMSSAELLNPRPGETVLDLAAAPGGKTTQISAKLGSSGLLVSNEIHPARARILAGNVERLGCVNTVVLQAPPDKLSGLFPAFFDKIMLDAPCSGEGMFRKDPEAVKEWSEDHVLMCAARQLDIMEHAVAMLKPGGTLAYSTCTFNRQENEELIAQTLERFPRLSLIGEERIWPHLKRGEGHYVAVLALSSEAAVSGEAVRQRGKPNRKPGKPAKPAAEAWQLFRDFAAAALNSLEALPGGEPLLFGEQLYWLPGGGKNGGFHGGLLEGVKAPRPGLHLATVKKRRVEPSHALALALPREAFRRSVSFPAGDSLLQAYLRGEALPAPGGQPDGWLAVCVDGWPLGWAKCSNGQLKNHYPKGLRSL